MRFIRFARDIKDIQGTYRDLAAEAARADDEASYKLTVMARGFARRSRRVVDDKLSFSATLMRAGEVDGANRLLDEVQTEVRTEEAALMEKVNEARVAQAVRKDKMTRLRLVRMVAVAVVGSMLMGLSAAGFAAVSYFDARERDAARNAQGFLKVASVEREMKANSLAESLGVAGKGGVADILMKLSMKDLLELEKMTDAGAGPVALEEFLVAALPSPELAKKLADTIAGAAAAAAAPAVAAPVAKKARDVTTLAAATKKRARDEAKAKEEAAEEETEASSEPSDEPSPDDQPTNDDKNPPDDDDGPTLPPGGPFDGQSSDKDGDGGLLD
jgi:hypothetical protein